MLLQGAEEVPVAGAEVAVRQGAQTLQLVEPELRGRALQGHEGHLQRHAGVGRDLAVPVRGLLQREVDDGREALPALAEARALLLQQLHGPVHRARGHAPQPADEAFLGDAALPGIPDGLQHQLQPFRLHQVAAIGAGGFGHLPGCGTGHGDLRIQDWPETVQWQGLERFQPSQNPSKGCESHRAATKTACPPAYRALHRAALRGASPSRARGSSTRVS